MIEKELITLLLKKDFYEENKSRIKKEKKMHGVCYGIYQHVEW